MHNAATQRIVALVDMDCFYCQVEARLNPSLKGKPMAVVQYNQWKGGGIIAVNYEARGKGVTRGMRGDEAKEKCPEINLVAVPTIRGKADLSNYRDAGEEVAKVFSEFSDCIQRASIDEAYLDLTKSVEDFMRNNEIIKPQDLPNTYVVGYCNLKKKNEEERIKGLEEWLKAIETVKMMDNANYRLAIGGIIVENMRAKILEKTGFHCSAGIGHNKILAKLTAGLHKPKKQTILPHESIPELYETLPIRKVRSLGGKLGKQVSEKLSINYMSELYRFSLQELQQKFDDKTSSWLYNIARGIDLDPVTVRLVPESIGCCKNFTGLNQLKKRSEVEHWLKELATEISERLNRDAEKNKRRAKLLTVSFLQETNMTRCGPLNSYEVEKIASDALELIKKFNTAPPGSDLWKPPIKNLGLSASKFTEGLTSIEKFLTAKKAESSYKSAETFESEKISVQPEVQTVPSTSEGHQLQRSFFKRYLDRYEALKKAEDLAKSRKERQNAPDENEEPAWISLSEVIPDVNETEPEVINDLPEPLKRKFYDRLSTSKSLGTKSDRSSDCGRGNIKPEPRIEDGESTAMTPPGECPKEKCSECGKNISLDVFLEHLDYHVAVKLSSEINRSSPVTPAAAKVHVENLSHSKRKKCLAKSPSKKMKSITSFFSAAAAPK